jgi:hypothetical protein
MPPKSQGESKQGLIITLVFFILATIGLGVATWFGFADQEIKDKAVADAKKVEKAARDERDWYKFQSQIYLSYMGQSQNIDLTDLGVKKGQFDQKSMKIDGYKDKDDATKLITDYDKRFGWNAKENKPTQTFESQLEKLKAENEGLTKLNQAGKAALADAKKKLTEAEEQLAAAKDTFTKDLAKNAKKSTDDMGNDRKLIDDLNKRLATAGTDLATAKTAAETQRAGLVKQLAAKETEKKFLAQRIRDQEDRLAALAVKSTQAPASLRTDWKIIKMDSRGQNPYINLGSADRVKPQLTFSIHGVGLDGRPIPQSKGTLEVVDVLRDHLSRVHITSVKDPNRDPILEGDVLYNPSWNPTIKKHVALAGIMDLTGDGRDSLAEFKRSLERQNIVVDAWLNPKDFAVKGKITVQTDYLILGESLDFQETGRGKNEELQKKLDVGINQMKAEALKNGVKATSLSKYLEMIGYRLPRGLGEEKPLYDPTARPERAPRPDEKVPPAAPAKK